MQTESKEISSVIQEFSRFAHKYDTYNVIQAKVASSLVSQLSCISYANILDIGAGSGEVYKNLITQKVFCETFTALDSAETMLTIHPEKQGIIKICANFNDRTFDTILPRANYDLVISSSALQWSTDLNHTFQRLSTLSNTFAGAIFTAGTFKTLHKVAKVKSPIYPLEIIEGVVNTYYTDVSFQVHNYKLEFTSTRDMFKYIKQSGVSSGERKLNYKQTKKLMDEYPLNYLEFEVLFIEAKK